MGELWYLERVVKELNDKAFIGVDLSTKEGGQVIIIHYSPATNGFKVIADTHYNKGSYLGFVRMLRDMCLKYNAEIIAMDLPTDDTPDLRSRIIPSKEDLEVVKQNYKPEPKFKVGDRVTIDVGAPVLQDFRIKPWVPSNFPKEDLHLVFTITNVVIKDDKDTYWVAADGYGVRNERGYGNGRINVYEEHLTKLEGQ